MISWKHNMTRKYELYKCTYIRDDTSTPGRIYFTSSRLFTPMTLPFRSLIFTLPLYVHNWSKYLFLCNFRTAENSLDLAAVRSSFIYVLICLSSLEVFRALRLEMTLYLVALERNLTIIGRGSSCLTLRGFGRRWLTSMSLCTNGGSSSRFS